MKRREVLKALLAAPLAGAVSSCAKWSHYHPRKHAVLRVILQGPFAVIVHKNEGNRITAYVPIDPDNLHEFRFQKLSREKDVQAPPRYQFELKTKGLADSTRSFYIDRCFDDARVQISNWKAEPSGYFVNLDLPAPQVISFIPPAETVTFRHGVKRTGHMPANHVLEYRIDDLDDVYLHSPQGRHKPTPCDDLVKTYNAYRAEEETSHQRTLPGETMSSPMQPPDLCSDSDVHTFFLGVGVSPDRPRGDKAAHGLSFFNSQLLPSLHDKSAAFEKELESIGDNGDLSPGRDNTSRTPGLTAAIWRGPARPMLRPISYIEDCKAPGLIAVTP